MPSAEPTAEGSSSAFTDVQAWRLRSGEFFLLEKKRRRRPLLAEQPSPHTDREKKKETFIRPTDGAMCP